ncbi:hypothetical protein QL285_022533 [Trifolium repens]|nr:hypothetical protein QL285_022533 [Trifolium repens]
MRLGFAPTGSPRYLNGTNPRLQLRKEQPLCKNSSETLTPKRQLFQKLIFNPETISKPRRIALRVHKFSTDASPIQRVSSAYCKCETITLPLPTTNPLNKFTSTVLRIAPPRPSATKRNKKMG